MASNFFTENDNQSVGAGVLSVTDLNTYAQSLLSSAPALQNVSIEGEISGFKRYLTSGHCYFTLKDSKSSVSCVMFKGYADYLRFRPEDGMRVIISGSADIYVPGGKFQFYAQSMRTVGEGGIFAAFLQLKDKLEKEGLFDSSRKKSLPYLPKAIGVVTSRSGAVFHDIINVTRRRFPNMPIILSPCQVQGKEAPSDICRALTILDNSDLCDVIIIGRGGGSMEDLWCFNDEFLARTIASCKKPVISAVGHETDFTIADFAADERAPTPSAAAELAVPEYDEILSDLLDLELFLSDAVESRLDDFTHRLRVAEATLRSPDEFFAVYDARLESAGRLLHDAVYAKLDIAEHRLRSLASELDTLSPLLPLRQGYAMVKGDDGTYIVSADVLKEKGGAQIVFSDGEVAVTVKD